MKVLESSIFKKLFAHSILPMYTNNVKPLPYYNCACAKISAECKIGDKQTVNFSSSERTNFEVDGLFISNFALRPDLHACAVVIGKGLILILNGMKLLETTNYGYRIGTVGIHVFTVTFSFQVYTYHQLLFVIFSYWKSLMFHSDKMNTLLLRRPAAQVYFPKQCLKTCRPTNSMSKFQRCLLQRNILVLRGYNWMLLAHRP